MYFIIEKYHVYELEFNIVNMNSPQINIQV